jgi:small-conductance mechanosensitive channel
VQVYYVEVMNLIVANWKSWVWSLGAVVVIVAVAEILFRLLYKAATRLAERGARGVRSSLLSRSKNPIRLIVWVAAILLATPTLPLSAIVTGPLYHLLSIALIASITWLSTALLRVVEDFMAAKYRIDIPDNLQARRIETQVRVLRRTAVGVVIVIGIAVMLMTFPVIRNVGAGLFASAGLAGLVVGMAARPGLSNMLAGLQIVLTQPIRLDDVVVVEGEWGRVEDIQTTYVVIRIWDQRRLILPLSYFIEKPFQNWTRVSADLLGTVFLHVDYSVPVDELRGELHRILESSPLWDKKVWNLQVTDADEHTVQLRALMSCSDSSSAWDLRCLVREQLIKFIQQHYPESLPRTRAELWHLGSDQHASSPDFHGAERH